MDTDPNNNVNRNWGFNVDLSGVQAPTGNASFLPEGYYSAVIDDMYVKPEKPNRVVIKLKLVDSGEFTGVVRTDGLNIPKDAEDKVRHYWRGLAESAGYTPAQLDAGQITLGVNTFKGKTVRIRFTPKANPNDPNSYENVLYLAPVEWSQQKQAWDASAGQRAAQSSQAQAPAGSALGGNPAPLGGGGPTALGDNPAPLGAAPENGAGTGTVNRGDVLSQLGLGG